MGAISKRYEEPSANVGSYGIMCGIAGTLNVSSNVATEMVQRLEHRGKTLGNSITLNNVTLAHTRLNIVGGNTNYQPFQIGNYVITFNGEIYNYLDLRLELISHGCKFTTKGDAEVILYAYITYGKSFIEHIKGIFAFAIYDGTKNILRLYRDRVGVKPLYYYKNDNQVFFASEIKALVPILKEVKVNNRVLCDYLTYQFSYQDNTLFKDIRKVLPGEYVEITNSGCNAHNYWSISSDSVKGNYEKYHTEEYYKDKLLSTLHASVKRQVPQVPFGVYASGGLDSSAVACLLSEYTLDRVTAYSGEYDAVGFSERQYIETLNVKNNIFSFSETDCVDNLISAIYQLDEPVAGPGLIGQYLLANQVRETSNIKVMFGGQGGDELFGGYARYIIAYLESAIYGAINQHSGNYVVTLNGKLSSLLPILKGYEPMLKKFWKNNLFADKDVRYFDLVNRNTKVGSEFENIYNENLPDIIEDFKYTFNCLGDVSYLTKMMYFDFSASLPALLQVDDRVNGAFEIEGRVPLLDEELVELAFNIPPTYKFLGSNPKGIMREAVRGLVPNKIVDRKDKMGFPVPFDKWYQNKGKFYEFVNDFVSNSNIVSWVYGKQELKSFDRDSWGKLSLAIWEKVYKVTI